MTNEELREIAYKLANERERQCKASDKPVPPEVYIRHDAYVDAVANAIWFDGACGMSQHQFKKLALYNFTKYAEAGNESAT